MSDRAKAAIGMGVVAAAAVPVVLVGAGFGAAGVIAGSIAAMVQVHVTMLFDNRMIFSMLRSFQS